MGKGGWFCRSLWLAAGPQDTWCRMIRMSLWECFWMTWTSVLHNGWCSRTRWGSEKSKTVSWVRELLLSWLPPNWDWGSSPVQDKNLIPRHFPSKGTWACASPKQGHKPRKKHTRFTENRKYRREPKRNPRWWWSKFWWLPQAKCRG